MMPDTHVSSCTFGVLRDALAYFEQSSAVSVSGLLELAG
jgi:hypothetical protein